MLSRNEMGDCKLKYMRISLCVRTCLCSHAGVVCVFVNHVNFDDVVMLGLILSCVFVHCACCAADAHFAVRFGSKDSSQVYLCVADGVGSWRQYGVDPRQFSHK